MRDRDGERRLQFKKTDVASLLHIGDKRNGNSIEDKICLQIDVTSLW